MFFPREKPSVTKTLVKIWKFHLVLINHHCSIYANVVVAGRLAVALCYSDSPPFLGVRGSGNGGWGLRAPRNSCFLLPLQLKGHRLPTPCEGWLKKLSTEVFQGTVHVPAHVFPYEEHFKQTHSSVVVGGVFWVFWGVNLTCVEDPKFTLMTHL